ncbi:hypothetical protein E4K66_30720 [Bradyrhizobium frederickii]|uniref:DUF1574 domain-containing protein n=1 Tax=Bradyrhizobium frederickii TaxID=2560054 RepID=A0A4Y9KXZ8_9BRAD|nr:hypothetical protein [Bradyrhizobium frederickii]TFV34542.1 hypothetical protein E4K66_30720 [Bradyrhizobium frederickii]
MIIISGSNAWFSIDSATMSVELRRPVFNAAVHFGLTALMMERVASEVRHGDLVLLPLEYEHYLQPNSIGVTEACYLLFDEFTGPQWSWLWFRAFTGCPKKLDRLVRLLPRRIFHSAAQDGLDLSVALTSEGDRRGNEEPLSTWRGGWRFNVAGNLKRIDQPRVEAAIATMKSNGAIVAVTFPVQPSESVSNASDLEVWRVLVTQWASMQGIPVVSSPQDHLFPDACFFDTPYHLHRGCTPKNTKSYVSAIHSIVPP